MDQPIPVVSIAKRKVKINLNGRQATPTGRPNNPLAVKYPHATYVKKLFHGANAVKTPRILNRLPL
jgi:hypothetical protein